LPVIEHDFAGSHLAPVIHLPKDAGTVPLVVATNQIPFDKCFSYFPSIYAEKVIGVVVRKYNS
jgi:hypothetical protein